MTLIAIDPGYSKRGRGCACALFDDGCRLIAVWFARSEQPQTWSPPTEALMAVHRIVWECPQPRTHGGTIASPETLVALTAEGAELAGFYAGLAGALVERRTPSDWKSSKPKPVQHAALWRVLTAAEQALLGGAAAAARIERAVNRGAAERWKRDGAYYYGTWPGHNVLDAVALGATVLGRLTKGTA